MLFLIKCAFFKQDASVKAASSSSNYSSAVPLKPSNSSSGTGTSGSSTRASATPNPAKPQVSVASSGQSSSSPSGRKSVFEETVQEVSNIPFVRAVTDAGTVVAGAAAANLSNLFSDKPPGISSNASSSGNRQWNNNRSSVLSQEEGDKNPNTVDCDAGEIEEMKKWAAKLRMINLISATLLILSSFFSLGSNQLTTLFIAFYVFFFAVLLCCYELALSAISRAIAENFGFMYNMWPRKIFILLVAVLCYELGLLGKIAMGLLVFAEGSGAYVQYKHPQFDKFTKLKHLNGVVDSADGTGLNVSQHV